MSVLKRCNLSYFTAPDAAVTSFICQCGQQPRAATVLGRIVQELNPQEALIHRS